jgi:hypothetical protein
MRSFSGIAVLVGSLLVTGCSATADTTSEESLTDQAAGLQTNTKMFLVPTTEAARTECRAEINSYYCASKTTDKAAAACVAKLTPSDQADCGADGSGCFNYESYTEKCKKTAPVYPTRASCKTPRPDNCAFYSACVESNIACGEDGYALGYGERFCTGFKNASFSDQGEAWKSSVMGCLQRALVPYTTAAFAKTSCSTVEDFAFNSHPACYTDPSNSICFLPPSDVLEVLSVIGLDQALQPRTQAQMATVFKTCVGQLADQLLGGFSAPAPIAPSSSAQSTPGDSLSAAELTERYLLWQKLDRGEIVP